MPDEFLIRPLPEMKDQRIHPRYLPGFAIIPACGRYCLLALLRHHYQRSTGHRCGTIKLPKKLPFLRKYVAYDPYDDFAMAREMLVDKYGKPPRTLGEWLSTLDMYGPVIVSGKGVGHAGFVRHFILIVGAKISTNELHYMDPLRGDRVYMADFSDLAGRIEACVHARSDIDANLVKYMGHVSNMHKLVFR